MSHWTEHLDPDAGSGRYLSWREVARVTGLSRTTAWRLQRRGEFPAPFVISPGRVGYAESEVNAWRASRERRGPTSPACAGETVDPPRSASPLATPERGPIANPPTPPADPNSPPAPTSRPRRRPQPARAITQQMRLDF